MPVSEKLKMISTLFFLSAIYDGVLGIAFIIMPRAIFQWFEVNPPNHYGYVHFPAALLIVFALMFLQIAKDPIDRKSVV